MCVYGETFVHNNRIKENLIMLLFQNIDLSISKLNLVQLGGIESFDYNSR